MLMKSVNLFRGALYTLIIIAFTCSPVSAAVYTYQYDNLNRLTKVVYGDGTTEEFTYDAAGNRLTHVVTEPDNTPPTGDVAINNGNQYTSLSTVTLSLSATDPGSGVSQMRFSNDGTTWSAWEPYATSKTWALAPGSGSKTVYVQFKDNAGNISTSYTGVVVLDADPPTGSIVINGGVAYTTNPNVTLTLSGTDTGSGVSQMRFSNDGISWTGWEPYATSKPWTLASGNGIKAVYVRYLDSAGNPSGIFSNTILLTKIIMDFDGDNKSDIAVWRPGDGFWYVIGSKDGSIISEQWGAGYAPYNDIPVPGDYDGDGITDIAIWRPSDGNWYIIRSSDGGVEWEQWGSGALNDIPVPGDYDGDGKTDIAVWRPADGYWYIISSKDGSITAQQWGTLGDIPVPGDYDGDGKTDIAVWRPGDGYWYIISSRDGSIISQQWGSSAWSDVPVPGDYDGDGKTDIAVWRPGDGYWYIISSKDGSIISQQWGSGALGDIPILGDYDGDGKTDIAVWRPTDGYWYIINSKDGSITATQWGAGHLNDEPISQ